MASSPSKISSTSTMSLRSLKGRFIAEAAKVGVELEHTPSFRKLSPYKLTSYIDIVFYAKAQRVTIHFDRLAITPDCPCAFKPDVFTSTLTEMRDEYDGSTYWVEHMHATGTPSKMLEVMLDLFGRIKALASE